MNFEKYVIDELKSISEKQDIILEQTIRQDENIKQNCKNIDDIKKNVIPEAIKHSSIKIKYMIAANGLVWAIGIITFLIKTFVFS